MHVWGGDGGGVTDGLGTVGVGVRAGKRRGWHEVGAIDLVSHVISIVDFQFSNVLKCAD